MTNRRAMIKLPRMTARLSYPNSNMREPGHYAQITVEDEDSGQLVCQIDLNPDQLFKLMASSTAYGEGQANAAAHRLGKVVVSQVVVLDAKKLGLTYGSDSSDPLVQSAILALECDGWEVVTYDRNRGTHRLVCSKWVPRDDA